MRWDVHHDMDSMGKFEKGRKLRRNDGDATMLKDKRKGLTSFLLHLLLIAVIISSYFFCVNLSKPGS